MCHKLYDKSPEQWRKKDLGWMNKTLYCLDGGSYRRLVRNLRTKRKTEVSAEATNNWVQNYLSNDHVSLFFVYMYVCK